MKKKVLIFDLDGTVADTVYSIRDGVNLTMDKYGFPRRSYEQIRNAIGNGARELIRLSVPAEHAADAELVERVLEDYNNFYGETYANIDGCYPHMKEAVCLLRKRGYLLAVLSNKQDIYVKKIIGALFENGEISFAAGQTSLPRKPDPTVPLMIAEMLGAACGECAFIGDSDVDIRTAKNAGMMSVACSWGYRPREALVGADIIIDSPQELLRIFR